MMVFFLSTSYGSLAIAEDKNGVSPQVITLPSGPGSIQGLGDSFQPQLNNGSGSYGIKISVPSGASGHRPELSLIYNTGNGNGAMGIGWQIGGLLTVQRSLDYGIPRYIDGPNGLDDDGDGIIDNHEEIDRFSGIDGEELVQLSDNFWRAENEGVFFRYEKLEQGWEVRAKNGISYLLGSRTTTRIENNENIFCWLLERITDLNGNVIDYRYSDDSGSPGQKYLSEIRWGQPGAFYAVVFSYEKDRRDIHSSYTSGFEVTTGLRLAQIDVIGQGLPVEAGVLTGDLNNDGTVDFLIRRYILEYDPDSHASLLQKVTQVGNDGTSRLPAVSLKYTRWTPPDNIAASIIRGTEEPTAAVNHSSVELIDMNMDGLPDLLSTSASVHRVYQNKGESEEGLIAWATVGSYVDNAPPLDIASPKNHLVDIDADGLADLAHKLTSYSFRLYQNTGAKAWEPSSIVVSTASTWPIWPYDGALGSLSRTLDIDHNRHGDILYTGISGYRLWMLHPGGQYSSEVRPPSVNDGSQTFRFDLPGTYIADLNGDSLQDLVWVQASRLVYWPSMGRGSFGPPQFYPLGFTLSSSDILKTGFSDVNGDGLPDLIAMRPGSMVNGIYYWLNLGQEGLDVCRTISGLPAINASDAIRWVDMNGNGSIDILIANNSRPNGYRNQVIDFVTGTRPHLISNIKNGIGLEISFEYDTSVKQMIEAEAKGSPWSSTMPISVPVVSKLTENDGLGTVYTQEFTYRDPYYDPEKQEFRGFAFAQIREPGDGSSPTRITKYWFDTGSEIDSLKGKVLKQEVASESDQLFFRTENEWHYRPLGADSHGQEVVFPENTAADIFLFEGGSDPVQLRSEFVYDDYGNVIEEKRLGITDGTSHEMGQDEILSSLDFIYDSENWILDRSWRQRTTDYSGELQAESRYYYDNLPLGEMGSHGRQTLQEDWLDTSEKYIASLSMEYDTYGNVIRRTDANNHYRTMVFDALLHTYPVSETVYLESTSLNSSASYDYGLGSITLTQDFNGQATSFHYDSFGRVTAISRPAGAAEYYSYDLSDPISHIFKQVRENVGGGTFDTYTFFDGYGRKRGVKSEAEDGQWLYQDVVSLSSRKQVKEQWLPYQSLTSAYEVPDPLKTHLTKEYDIRDRPVKLTNPDGTYSSVVYEPLAVHTHDENDTAGSNTPKSVRHDGLGRIVEVTERNGPDAQYITSYEWNTLGDLTKITDPQNNQKTISYDSLRRKILMDDPDRGRMNYEYDDVGNLIRTKDNKSQEIVYSYDAANRILSEDYLDDKGIVPDVSYHYDDPSADHHEAANLKGRVSWIKDVSGGQFFSYDSRGNPLWTVKRIDDSGTVQDFKAAITYDAMDRVTSMIWPDNDIITYTYNARALLESIPGIVDSIDYHASGQIAAITHANGISTSYTYDPRHRLSSLHSHNTLQADEAIQHLTYTLDGVSNITQISDGRPIPADSPKNATQSFRYDDLYRLTHAEGPGYGAINFQYDKVGNMIHKTSPAMPDPAHIDDNLINLGQMTIGAAAGAFNRTGRLPGDDPGPHAITGAESGLTYDYDDNGNMILVNGDQYTWDFKDRLVRVQKGSLDTVYVYDYSGQRVLKRTTENNVSKTTHYTSKTYEVRQGSPVKYVFAGTRRVAQIKGSLDQLKKTRAIALQAGWNLIALDIEPNDPAVSEALSSIEGKYTEVWAYEPASDNYIGLVPGKGVDDLTAIHAQTGYFVYMAQGAELTVTGTKASNDQPLTTGWNLISCPTERAIAVSEALSAIEGKYEVLWAFDAETQGWQTYAPGRPPFLNTLETLESGKAYWIQMKSDETLSHTENPSSIRFYHPDHLGSTNIVSDENGTVLETTEFYPFGRPRYEEKTGFESAYKYTGKELDAESGLMYYEVRYYNAVVGRFVSVDPYHCELTGGNRRFLEVLTNPQQRNLYTYVSNNPIIRVDIFGLDQTEIYVALTPLGIYPGMVIGTLLFGPVNPIVGSIIGGSVGSSGIKLGVTIDKTTREVYMNFGIRSSTATKPSVSASRLLSASSPKQGISIGAKASLFGNAIKASYSRRGELSFSSGETTKIIGGSASLGLSYSLKTKFTISRKLSDALWNTSPSGMVRGLIKELNDYVAINRPTDNNLYPYDVRVSNSTIVNQPILQESDKMPVGQNQ